jgi:membrane-associated phospholipid phosphatase
MLDPMALQESDENTATSAVSKPFHVQFARLISTVLSPIVVSIPAMLMVVLYHQDSSSFFFGGIALLFLSIGPTLYILVGLALGKFSDFDVTIRSQRTGPFLFGISSALIGFFVLQSNHAPKHLTTILLGTVLIGLILMITTFWWKISIHASSLSAALTLLAVLYGRVILPAFLLLALVCWSRVVLKRHTLAQVTAGALLTMVATLLLFAWQGI